MQPPAIQLQTKITQKVKYLLQDAVDKAENRFFVPPLLYGLFLTQTCITQKSHACTSKFRKLQSQTR